MTDNKEDFGAIEEALKKMFGDDDVGPEADEMIPACLGVLVHKSGGRVVITQADLDEIEGTKMRVSVDPVAETITLTTEKVEA